MRQKKCAYTYSSTSPYGYNNWREYVMAIRRKNAVNLTAQAIRLGLLPEVKKLICIDCGAPAWCYDHRDYDIPLMVEPVCRKCNCVRGPAKPYLPLGSDRYKKLLRLAKFEYKWRSKK